MSKIRQPTQNMMSDLQVLGGIISGKECCKYMAL